MALQRNTKKGTNIVLPNLWVPRPHQLKLWSFLELGGKRAVAVWHRRAGKDSTALNYTACATHQRIGNYWHMLPEAKQGRKVVWEAIDKQGRRIIDQVFPPILRASKLEDEMMIRLRCGSTWQVVGSDNYNALVGANPIGIVFSEYSVADPRAWDFLRPILAENGGWALFIFTPRGHNHGEEIKKMAEANANWFCEVLTADDTRDEHGNRVISQEIIEEERRSGMEEDMVQQEFYCSFSAAIRGSYYGKEMERAEREKRIGHVPFDPTVRVHTAWDLGIGDSMAIWFVQVVGREIRFIDYYENHGVGLDHYAMELTRRPYVYGLHVLPHDAQARELSTGRTRLQTLQSLLGAQYEYQIVPRGDVDDGINSARMLLPRCYWDAAKCKRGVEALQQYHRAWNDERRTYENRPHHDWTSHPADAFRTFAMSRIIDQYGMAVEIASGGQRSAVGRAMTEYDPLEARQ